MLFLKGYMAISKQNVLTLIFSFLNVEVGPTESQNADFMLNGNVEPLFR